MNIYWSARTASGVMGDATKATPAKGEQFLEAAVEGLIELVRELRQTPILPRRDQHR
jgi:creatinine amidohydrolase/Fe(II)-dependent formamide hydrolase-like protein